MRRPERSEIHNNSGMRGETNVSDNEKAARSDGPNGASAGPPRSVAVVGMGYVGLPTALAFHEAGFEERERGGQADIPHADDGHAAGRSRGSPVRPVAACSFFVIGHVCFPPHATVIVDFASLRPAHLRPAIQTRWPISALDVSEPNWPA